MNKKRYLHITINGVKKKLHRHVVEQFTGKILASNEHVYHINGDGKDNRIENLIVITKNYKENQ